MQRRKVRLSHVSFRLCSTTGHQDYHAIVSTPLTTAELQQQQLASGLSLVDGEKSNSNKS